VYVYLVNDYLRRTRQEFMT